MLCQWFRVTKTKVSTKKKAGDHQKVGQLQKWVIITMFMRSKAYVLIWFLGDFILPMVNSILVSYFVSYPCIVSYPFCMYRILVFYPCIVFVLYEYVLRSHRIVGYQYTYRIHKIYNFSGIQLGYAFENTVRYLRTWVYIKDTKNKTRILEYNRIRLYKQRRYKRYTNGYFFTWKRPRIYVKTTPHPRSAGGDKLPTRREKGP